MMTFWKCRLGLMAALLLLWPHWGWAWDKISLNVLTDLESQAIAMFKDRDEFVWIATYVDGLYRFDGKRLQHYGPSSGLVQSNSVQAIVEDRAGRLWLAAAGGGLTCFDKDSNRITTYRHNPLDHNSLSSNAFFWAGKRTMIADGDGLLWIGTIGGGLNRFDPQTGIFRHFHHEPNNPQSLSSDNVRTLSQNSRGDIWIGTENGINRIRHGRDTIERYRAAAESEANLDQDVIMWLLEDESQGLLWIGTENHGLKRLTLATGAVQAYRYDPKNPESIGADRVVFIFQDEQGILWLSHENHLSFFDPKTGRFKRHEERNGDITQLMPDSATGKIWALTDSGKLGLIQRGEPRFKLYRPEPGNPNSLATEIVVTIYEDTAGILWISNLGALNRYDPTNGQFRHYLHDPLDPTSIPSPVNYMPAIFEDSRGIFWLGGSLPASISIFDRVTGKIVQTYLHDPANPYSLPDAQQINRFREDRHDPNIFWIATANGLLKFDQPRQRFTAYGRDDSWDVYEDETSQIWVATWGNGLARFDRATERFTYYRHDPHDANSISDNAVIPIFQAANGQIWIGTENGLNRFDRQRGQFQRFTRADGYPWDAIHSIGEDRQGQLWLGTNNGLARFDPTTRQFRHYTREDGIQGSMFYANNGIMSRSGEMWFGGTKGMNSFFPEQVNDNHYLPSVRLTSMKQGGEEIDFGAAPERLKSLTLDWRYNFFEFEFVAFDYTNPRKNQYAFMLEGLDKAWFKSDTRNFGRYSAIPPGHYTLRLKGSNNDGIWNESGMSLPLIVLPPFWRTGWFYAAMVLALLALLLAIMSYLIRLNREIRERKNAQARLQEANQCLEKLNIELRHFDALKDEFLANTSHELRTPLNGIIGLAESLMDGATGSLAEKTRENLAMIVASGKRLANLINDILDFSKLRHQDLHLKILAVDVMTLVDVVIAILQPLLAGKRLQLLNLIAPNTPLVSADENRLQQIFCNLIGNAIKFTEAGMVTISAAPLANDFLEISVADTGIGIPADQQDRVFEAFAQVDGSIARTYGGTGLGLAVTKQLVTLHGGTIAFSSELGRGSRFYFSLPLSRECAPSTAPAPTPTTPSIYSASAIGDDTSDARIEENGLPSGTLNILLVDDEPVNLQVLTNHLTTWHYHVTRTINGFEALAVIDRMAEAGRPFDLVLLDVMMPKMSGYEVCKRLREKYPPDLLPVVMLTAKNRVEDLVAGLEVGANDYVSKPFSKSELLARIKNQCAMKFLADDRKRLEQRLLQAQKMESIGTLAGGIAHDFNNILSAIIGYAEIGLWETDDEKMIKNYRGILEAGERAKELVNQILAFSRQSKVEPRPVKLKLIVKETLKLLRASLPSSIEITSALHCDAAVMADPTQMHQVIMNLCTNASHALAETGGILHVALEETAIAPIATSPAVDTSSSGLVNPSERWLRLTVQDNGCGIPATIIDRIFDPFFTTKARGQGTGMGLAVVHGIVTASRGEIHVESQVGEGTSFFVHLPIWSQQPRDVSEPVEGLCLGTERILFVDDEAFQIDLGQQTLHHLGYTVTIARDGRQAFELFRVNPQAFDLVITDLTMPKMTGDRLAQEILAIRPDMPIIICTGYSDRITAEGANALGIKGFALKPLVIKELAKLIRQVLDGK